MGRRRIGWVAVGVLVAGVMTAAPATAKVEQQCGSRDGFSVCIERWADGWHARAWHPSRHSYAHLYNGSRILVSTYMPPGGGNQVTQPGRSPATTACVSAEYTSALVICVDIRS